MMHDARSSSEHECETREPSDEDLAHIRSLLRGLRFGSVNIIVQDGIIIQVERTEKRRLKTRREQWEARG